MIRKISDILKEKSRTYSFEFFPPKTEKGTERLYETAGELKKLNPEVIIYISCNIQQLSKDIIKFKDYIIQSVGLFDLFPQTNLLYAYLIVFASQFFDWASAPYVFFKIEKPTIFCSFYKLQKKFDNRLDKPWGVIGQVAFLFGLVFFAVLI